MTRWPFRDGGAGDGDGPGAAPSVGLREAPDGSAPLWFEAGEVVWLAAQRERLLRAAAEAEAPAPLPQSPPDTADTEGTGPHDAPPPRDATDLLTPPEAPGVDAPDGLPPPPGREDLPARAPAATLASNGAPRPADPVRPAPARVERMESALGELGRQLPLDRSRAIEKAMLPLKRRVEAPNRCALDEDATAVTAAELGVWLPRERPLEERWLTLTLLTDPGDSMRLWTATAQRLRDTLHGSGAFRDVRLAPWSGPTAGPPPVPGTDGRQVLLVLSDLYAAHWSDGTAPRTLARWARQVPVTVVHTLPEHIWARTGTYAPQVGLTSPRPAAPNGAWTVTRDAFTLLPEDLWQPSAEDDVPVPVVPLSPEGLGRWARFTAGGYRGEYAVRALPAAPVAAGARPDEAGRDAMTAQDARGAGEAGERAASAVARARALRARLSPTAYRLARLCAALPRLNLSLLRLVQARLLPEARTWHVAELLLSGLLRHVPADREVPAPARADLEIGDGVRRELLSDGTRSETALAVMLAADHIAATAQGAIGHSFSQLGRLLRDPTRAPRMPVEVLEPWFSSTSPVFAAMGAPYATAMTQLSDTLSAARAAQPPAPPPVAQPAETSGPGVPLGGAAEDSGFDDGDSGTAEEGNVTVSGLQSAPVGTRSDGLQKPPPVWGNVPPRNRAFTGRAELLENLHSRLQEGTTAVLPEALQGMGGVGKSQLAVEYVYRHMHEYQVIWWIPSEQSQQIRQFLVMLAGRLGLNVGSGEANTAVPAVIEALRIGEPYKNWLLVFDNAENPEAVREFFPTNGPGRILVTSRNAQWATSARPLEVDVFTREESRELLQLRAPMLDDRTADRLAETLGDLPLGIEQAAVWLAETGMPADEYLRLFEQQANELMLSDPPPDYPLSVAAAWNVSLERLRRNHPAALQLLQVCAFVAPEPISRRLFTGVRDAPVPPELNAALSDPIRLGRAIREINRYALARINHNANTIQLHRLVQRVLINQMPDQLTRQLRKGAHWLLAQGDPGEPTASHQWQQYGELLPHVLHSRAVESTDPWVRQLVLNEIQYMYSWGDHEGALDLAEQAYHTWQNESGGSPEQTLAAAKLFTDALRILGRYPEAFELDQRTLTRMTEVLGPDHESTLEITSMLAWDHRLRGEYERAMELDKHAYETCERLFGPNDLSTLLAAHRHALNLRFVGEFRQALELDQITHRRKVEELGENAQSTLSTMAAVVLDLQEAGEYVRARDLVEDLTARYQYNYGEMHPASMATTKMLAVAERRAGHHDAALELSGKAHALFRTRYGDKYPSTVNALLAHAIDVRHSGDLPRALELGQQGVDGYRHLLGDGHPHTVAARVNHAVCLRLTGQVEQAHALDEAAHRRLAEVQGADHPYTLSCLANLVADLYELGEAQASVDLARDALANARRRLGEEHPVTLATALNLSLGLRLLGREDEAEPLYEETLERYRRTLGSEHPASLAAAGRRIANCDIDPLPM